MLSGRNLASERIIKTIIIRNRHASSTQTVTVKFDVSATERYISPTVTLQAGEVMEYTESTGWQVKSAGGVVKTSTSAISPFIPFNQVVLAAPVINAEAVANTITDITGLSFAVVADSTYWFRFFIPFTSAATTTGVRFTVNGPAAPTALSYRSSYPITATTLTTNFATAYDIPAAANADTLTAGGTAMIEGVITPSVDGTVIARFASEVTVSAVTALAGATLHWAQVI
jgi:hypothetical protein